MPSTLNKVILIGQDPKLAHTTSGQPVASFSMATDESYKAAEKPLCRECATGERLRKLKSPELRAPGFSREVETMRNEEHNEMTYNVKQDYAAFVRSKSQSGGDFGFDPVFMPDCLFPFQAHLAEWAIKKGKSALFEDCGLGKTIQALTWAENVHRKTGKPVLIITPLAVAAQTIREAQKFNFDGVAQSRDGNYSSKIVVTNYERLHYFNHEDFGGVVADESSAIKAFDGKRRKQVTRFMSKMPYRLLCTATPAPNDFIELGTSSEALGVMTQSDMIGHFFMSSDKQRHTLFKDGDFWNKNKYFFKPHAEVAFWRFVTAWARAIRKPSDMGFDDTGFVLPELIMEQHVVKADRPYNGTFFVMAAKTLADQRKERKITMQERCAKVRDLVAHDEPAVVWCQYNEEGDILQKMIPDCVQVAGADSDDVKEDRLEAFSLGKVRVLVTKPKIGAWGLNWQHCGHHTFFPSHSFEQFYQATRRSLRFGRVGPVKVDIVTTEGEAGVTANLKKKQDQAGEMFDALLREMNNSITMQTQDNHKKEIRRPSWL